MELLARLGVLGNGSNQYAYLPDAIKRASVVSDAQEPIAWTLKNTAGEELLTGMTTVFGLDASSQDPLHLVDFSSLTQPGEYVLEVAGETSHPFEIRADAYRALKYDALRYFYHNRSGVEIETRTPVEAVAATRRTRSGHALPGTSPKESTRGITTFPAGP